MRQWLKNLVQRNRGEGPKPSGLCLWQHPKELERLVIELTAEVMTHDDSWASLSALQSAMQRQLKR